MAVLLLTDRRFEGNRLLRNFQDLFDLALLNVQLVRDLLRRRLTAQLLHHGVRRAQHTVDRLDHVHRNADRTRLVGDGAGDGLPDPPGRIGGEFIALCIVEFFNSLHQAQIALLDEIEKLHPPAHVALCDRHDETQIGLRHTLACVLVALGHFFRDLLLLLRRQELDAADLLEVHPHRVVQLGVFHVLGQRLRLVQIRGQALVLDGLHFTERGVVHISCADEVQHVGDVDLDAGLLKNVIEALGLVLRGVHVVERFNQMLGGNLSGLFRLGNQRFEFLPVFCREIHLLQKFHFFSHCLPSILFC